MPLLPESSAFKAETCNGPVRKGQNLGNRVVKKRERKKVDRNTGKSKQEARRGETPEKESSQVKSKIRGISRGGDKSQGGKKEAGLPRSLHQIVVSIYIEW